MKNHDSVALICHETQKLRLRGAELESRAKNATQELREAVKRRRELVARLRESQGSLRRVVSEVPRRTPKAVAPAPRPNQRGSAR